MGPFYIESVIFARSFFFWFHSDKNIHNIKRCIMERGKFTLILGNMFAGKTEELIRRLRRAEKFENKKVIAFKPKIDTRSGNGLLKTAQKDEFPATDVESIYDVFKKIKQEIFFSGKKPNIIAFDEIQFFPVPLEVYSTIDCLLDNGYDVIVAGLKLDFKGEPFESSTILLGHINNSSNLFILNSCCSICGADAEYPQRIIDGKPAKYTDQIKLVGGEESYQPRCHTHFIIREKPPTT